MRRLAAILSVSMVATVLVLAQPAAARALQVAAASEYSPPAVTWAQCAGPFGKFYNAECGFVIVPLDYGNPTGPTIKLAVSRIRHAVPDNRYQGIMLVNPGGPGGSGLTLPIIHDWVPNNAGDAYDWIGFDPRGVGSSEPSLSCDGGYFGYARPQYIPYSRTLEQTWLDRSKGYAQACTAAGADLLEHLKTTDSVQDMDSIRKSLGEEKLSLYGFSYGTYLGQVYSTLYPGKVYRMVLDGVVDPTRVWYQANLDQDLAFDKNMDVYFKWLAKYDGVFDLGTDWRKIKLDYYEQYAKLTAQPAGGVIGPDELSDVMLYAGYYAYPFYWVNIGHAFAALVNRSDYEPLKELYDEFVPQGPGTDNGYAIYLATQCTDAPWPQQWSTVRRDNWLTFARAPFETWNNAWFNGPCQYWSAPSGNPVHVDGASAPPLLLISETKDAATPYSGALKTRSLYPKSVLIEGVGGTTHAGSLSGVTCTDDKIAAYLATGALPARVPGNRSDAQCDPVPQPDPTAVAAAATARSAAPDSDLATVVREQIGRR